MTKKVGIVDYGCGNIRSLLNAFKLNSADAELLTSPGQLRRCSKLVLPGVGAFGNAMTKLEQSGFRDALEDYKATGLPILGICLGMQLMCRHSDEIPLNSEFEKISGLGWIDAEVRHFAKDCSGPLKVPHMGWNELRINQPSVLFEGISDGADVYFVHSHAVHCDQKQDILTYSQYGCEFVSAFARDNLYGMQFHPEKSHKTGLRMIRNFIEMAS